MSYGADKRNKLLQAQLDASIAQNSSLTGDNTLLRSKISRLANDSCSTATLHVEAKIKAFDLENERDRMFENLERLKKKYNKLHEAYLETVKRCAALENVFQRQKTLTGLVMKSTVEQQKNDGKISVMKHFSNAENENLEGKIARLQASLHKAYDIIDELEFELESIDFLEIENQRLHKELNSLKTLQCKAAITSIDSTDNSNDNHNNAIGTCYQMRLSTASSTCQSCFNEDNLDSASLKRAALTNSLIRMAEAESHCMRRELLRCRLQNTVRPKDSSETR